MSQIIGAPAFFPTVWGWIKRWFDPITVSKIFILSSADVFPTLSQYIDPDNIPKKYGGNLDFNWGDMPRLEPDIEAAIKWVNPAVQDGKNTVPIGPIKWDRGTDGSMTAVAIGTEKGQPRNRAIFTIPSPVNAKPQQPIVNTPIDEAELALTTVGTATQPPNLATAVDTEEPPSDSPTTSTPKSEPQTANTESLPIRTAASTAPAEQASSDPDGTQGPGYVEKAKEAVEQAASTVAGLATGAKEKTEEKAPERTAEKKEAEAKIDEKEGPVIEGFLREKTASM